MRIFKVVFNSPYYHEEQKGSVFYAESWALTHYLMVTDHVKHVHRLDDYTALLRQHVDPVTAGEKAFGDLKEMQSELESYIRDSDYKQFVLTSAAAPLDESSYKVRSFTQIEADAARADVLAYINRPGDARALVDTVLTEDPNNVLANKNLRDASNVRACKQTIDASYGEASQCRFCRTIWRTTTLLRYPAAAQAAAHNKEIEDSLRSARLNPRFAPAYVATPVF